MQPIINLDDPVGKTVGKRRAADVLGTSVSEQEGKYEWCKAGLGLRVPKGVYRFHSHEEADEWLMKMMTRPRN